MLFDNRRDASARLDGTIVFYQKKAMYVRGIDDRLRLVGYTVLDTNDVTVEQDNPELSMICPEVGFINTPDATHYFMRQPMRRWKQGIDLRALVCPYSGIRARGVIDERMLAMCLESRYPSFEEVAGGSISHNPFKSVEKRGQAFSKHFAVGYDAEGKALLWKGRKVGIVEERTPVLSTKYQWLQESLEGVI